MGLLERTPDHESNGFAARVLPRKGNLAARGCWTTITEADAAKAPSGLRPVIRAIIDPIVQWRRRYQGVPGAAAIIDSQVREWCEQVLVEVVLAARNSSWDEKQIRVLFSRCRFSAALLSRHLVHAMLGERLPLGLGLARAVDGFPSKRDPSPATPGLTARALAALADLITAEPAANSA